MTEEMIEQLEKLQDSTSTRSHWDREYKPRSKRCVGKKQFLREKELRQAKRNAKDWRDWPAQAERSELEHELEDYDLENELA